MMKLITLATLVLSTFFSMPSFARGGDWVNNGGGLAEKNILYAYKKLPTFSQACLKSDVCKITPVQKEILQKILENLKNEIPADQIQFASEKAAPGTFLLDGQVRVAKTGDRVGSPLFINVDLLYVQDETGAFDATTVPEAVAILLHELGHHHGHYSHELLDMLGVNVSMYLQKKLVSTPMIPWEADISATVFNPGRPTSFPEVLIYVGDEVIDASALYAETVKCELLKIPIPLLPVPDLTIADEAPVASILHNIHWNWEKIKTKDNEMDVQITGNVSNTCKLRSEGKIRNNNFNLGIGFKVVKKDGKWTYVKASKGMKQYKNPWYKIIKLPF